MKKSILLLVSVLVLFINCDNPTIGTDEQESDDPVYGFSEKDIINGRMRIRFEEEPAITRNSGGEITIDAAAFDGFATSLGMTRMERTFPHAGKFEERTRREGLHLWYDIWFSEEVVTTRAVNNISEIDGIEIAAPVLKVISTTSTRNDDYPFNDPYLPRLWSYHNTGAETWQQAGSDIRLFDAWELYTGHPDIIIAIVDGGIALDNPDLQDNLWINPGEVSGNGVDDDGNGYIDDIYGYNFVSMTSEITPQRHGTHVAGTIAATNNNGIGISGIAGGDGTPNSGVKLMSCQIFEHPDGVYYFDNVSDHIPAAIKYGADNGAIISQNSWGYPLVEDGYIDPADKEAIDYFIKYAGCDNDGNQLPGSPMKGGIVLFASGNMNSSRPGYAAPADYDKVLGVAAIGADYIKAPYSNYGTYTDIAAPGGLQESGRGIYSTTISQLDYYEYRYGTSMACPHVSGVAALVIQKYGVGQQGFTATQLQDILLLTAYDLDSHNPEYAGLLGYGCVDALAALSSEPTDNQLIEFESAVITNNILSFKVRSDIVGDGSISIVNATGNTVLRKSVKTRRYTSTEVDITKLAAGYYILTYECEGAKVEGKFVKY